jgi:hypothetical protein
MSLLLLSLLLVLLLAESPLTVGVAGIQEWEEKLTQSNEAAESYKEKYRNLKESMKTDGYLDQARSFSSRLLDGQTDGDIHTDTFGSVKSHSSNKAGSVASLGSGLAQHARTIVSTMNSNFNCSNLNERNGPVVQSELSELRDVDPRGRQSASFRQGERSRSRSKSSKSFRQYSRSPQRLDV